ncbi:MAG: hypothetical protein HYV15_04360 [Elusimicrobia bacterium]|nr:hypothetical protein [Elusimicrobiota bacterium]
MGANIMGGVLLLSALASVCSAAQAVEGESLGVDPYVKEFQTAMQQADAELAAIKSAILAVQVPQGTKAGALAAGVKAAGEYAAVEGVVLRAEQAHAKFLAHVMGFDTSDDIDFKLNLKGPAFAEKKDAPLRPKADPTLKGASGGVSKALAGGAAAPQKLAAVSSKYSYSSAGGPVGSGFSAPLSPSESQAAVIGTIGTPVGGAGPLGAGVGSGAPDGAAGVAKTASAADVAPTKGPDPRTLSANTSNVAEVAFQRAQERQRAAEAELKARQDKKDQRNQQMAQMAQQMLGQAGQAMGKTKDSAGGCKNCNKGKQDESQAAAAKAPA